jgi:DNA-binding GntR family transcriptional regulator
MQQNLLQLHRQFHRLLLKPTHQPLLPLLLSHLVTHFSLRLLLQH